MNESKGRAHLIERYPQLLDGSVLTGPGWDGVISQLFENLIATQLPIGFRIRQVKEESGNLRVDHNGDVGLHGPFVEFLIACAAERGSVTCETCGQEGSLTDLQGRVSVRCASCLQRQSEM